ncbi:hypothetical protein BH09BAC3_BH09BAC3_33710 [soil metagenome]
MNFRILFVVIFVFASACTTDKREYEPKANNPEFLHRAIKAVTDRIVYDIFSPPVASRIYAYSSVAAYEAARHADKNFISLSGQIKGLDSIPQPDENKEYCYQLAAVQAALVVGKAMVFSEDEMDVFYQKIMQDFRETGLPEEVFNNSIDYGSKVAARVMQWSSTDNYKQSRSFPKYTIQNDVSTWKPTPPAYMDAVEPHWNKLRVFAIDSAGQFKPAPALPFSIDKKSPFYAEANEVYQIGKNLTDEQRSIASFWDCNPFVMNVRGHVMFATKKISPGGHWMNITRVACTMVKADVVHSAEAYVRVALSLADGFISCWDEKYRSNVIRPETYINQNIDENWIPLLQTPPFPEYTSGHSVISNSAAIALTGLLGESFAFTDSTETEFGLTARKFESFNQAAAEAAVSRIYGGIHYRAAVDQGVLQGRKVGNFIQVKIKTRQ